MENLTEQMLNKAGIEKVENTTLITEVNEDSSPAIMKVTYASGSILYVTGEQEINNFINRVIANK